MQFICLYIFFLEFEKINARFHSLLSKKQSVCLFSMADESWQTIDSHHIRCRHDNARCKWKRRERSGIIAEETDADVDDHDTIERGRNQKSVFAGFGVSSSLERPRFRRKFAAASQSTSGCSESEGVQATGWMSYNTFPLESI